MVPSDQENISEESFHLPLLSEEDEADNKENVATTDSSNILEGKKNKVRKASLKKDTSPSRKEAVKKREIQVDVDRLCGIKRRSSGSKDLEKMLRLQQEDSSDFHGRVNVDVNCIQDFSSRNIAIVTGPKVTKPLFTIELVPGFPQEGSSQKPDFKESATPILEVAPSQTFPNPGSPSSKKLLVMLERNKENPSPKQRATSAPASMIKPTNDTSLTPGKRQRSASLLPDMIPCTISEVASTSLKVSSENPINLPFTVPKVKDISLHYQPQEAVAKNSSFKGFKEQTFPNQPFLPPYTPLNNLECFVEQQGPSKNDDSQSKKRRKVASSRMNDHIPLTVQNFHNPMPPPFPAQVPFLDIRQWALDISNFMSTFLHTTCSLLRSQINYRQIFVDLVTPDLSAVNLERIEFDKFAVARWRNLSHDFTKTLARMAGTMRIPIQGVSDMLAETVHTLKSKKNFTESKYFILTCLNELIQLNYPKYNANFMLDLAMLVPRAREYIRTKESKMTQMMAWVREATLNQINEYHKTLIVNEYLHKVAATKKEESPKKVVPPVLDTPEEPSYSVVDLTWLDEKDDSSTTEVLSPSSLTEDQEDKTLQKKQVLPAAVFQDRQCFCGQRADYLCYRCKSVMYCNAACQLKDWPTHKIICKKQTSQSEEK